MSWMAGRHAASDGLAAHPTRPRLSLSPSAIALIVMVCVLALATNHQYRGIFHDARLYLLQALSRLYPESLPQDIFLRYGSQDRYTLFGAPLAFVIRLIGAEHGAALVTAVSQAALLGGACILARTLVPRALALLGVAMLITLPGTFGMRGVFMVIEPFLSPRMLAEALVLASLAAAMRNRRLLSVLLCAAAALCHPLIAMAGAVALATFFLIGARPRYAGAAILCGALAFVAVAAWHPLGLLPSFDEHWLGLIRQRSPILFLKNWDLWDWSRLAPAGATLAAGAICLPQSTARQACTAALLTGVGAIALTGLACDGLHVVLFTQLQPWRWLWLDCAIAALLLPAILQARWSAGASAQPTVMLLLALWVFGDFPASLLVAALALASLWPLRPGTTRVVRMVWLGACAVLAIACLWRIASDLEFTSAAFLDNRLPGWVRRLISAVSDGTLWLAIVGLILAVDRLAPAVRRAAFLLLGLAGLATGAELAPSALLQWTRMDYTPAYREALAPFRAAIPPGTSVLWDGPSAAAWVLLERPDYLVPAETAGMLYSRDTALEMERRVRALSVAIPADAFLSFDAPAELTFSVHQLADICATGEIPFLITWKELGFAMLETVQAPPGPSASPLKLYRCPTHSG